MEPTGGPTPPTTARAGAIRSVTADAGTGRHTAVGFQTPYTKAAILSPSYSTVNTGEGLSQKNFTGYTWSQTINSSAGDRTAFQGGHPMSPSPNMSRSDFAAAAGQTTDAAAIGVGALSTAGSPGLDTSRDHQQLHNINKLTSFGGYSPAAYNGGLPAPMDVIVPNISSPSRTSVFRNGGHLRSHSHITPSSYQHHTAGPIYIMPPDTTPIVQNHPIQHHTPGGSILVMNPQQQQHQQQQHQQQLSSPYSSRGGTAMPGPQFFHPMSQDFFSKELPQAPRDFETTQQQFGSSAQAGLMSGFYSQRPIEMAYPTVSVSAVPTSHQLQAPIFTTIPTPLASKSMTSSAFASGHYPRDPGTARLVPQQQGMPSAGQNLSSCQSPSTQPSSAQSTARMPFSVRDTQNLGRASVPPPNVPSLALPSQLPLQNASCSSQSATVIAGTSAAAEPSSSDEKILIQKGDKSRNALTAICMEGWQIGRLEDFSVKWLVSENSSQPQTCASLSPSINKSKKTTLLRSDTDTIMRCPFKTARLELVFKSQSTEDQQLQIINDMLSNRTTDRKVAFSGTGDLKNALYAEIEHGFYREVRRVEVNDRIVSRLPLETNSLIRLKFKISSDASDLGGLDIDIAQLILAHNFVGQMQLPLGDLFGIGVIFCCDITVELGIVADDHSSENNIAGNEVNTGTTGLVKESVSQSVDPFKDLSSESQLPTPEIGMVNLSSSMDAEYTSEQTLKSAEKKMIIVDQCDAVYANQACMNSEQYPIDAINVYLDGNSVAEITSCTSHAQIRIPVVVSSQTAPAYIEFELISKTKRVGRAGSDIKDWICRSSIESFHRNLRVRKENDIDSNLVGIDVTMTWQSDGIDADDIENVSSATSSTGEVSRREKISGPNEKLIEPSMPPLMEENECQ